MRPSLCFLSLGLLALGANLPGTSGQRGKAVHGFHSPTEKLPLSEKVIITCLADGFGPNASMRWFHNDKAVRSSVNSASSPMEDREIRGERLLRSSLTIQQEGWETGAAFYCMVEPNVLPPLTVQTTTDKDRGNPSASGKTILEPHFQEAESESKMSMSCIVEGKRPQGITIVWRENGSPLLQGTYDIHYSSEDPCLMYSNLTLHKTSRSSIGKSYSCIIGHQGLKIQKTTEKTPVKNESHPHLQV